MFACVPPPLKFSANCILFFLHSTHSMSLAVLCILYKPICIHIYLNGFFPHGESFLILRVFTLHGVFPWSVQGHHRPKSVVCVQVVILAIFYFQLVSFFLNYILVVLVGVFVPPYKPFIIRSSMHLNMLQGDCREFCRP